MVTAVASSAVQLYLKVFQHNAFSNVPVYLNTLLENVYCISEEVANRVLKLHMKGFFQLGYYMLLLP